MDVKSKKLRRGGIGLWVMLIVVGAVCIGLGYLLGRRSKPVERVEAGTGAEVTRHERDGETVWTCSMHPQIRRTEPGLCPICNMELIPVSDSEVGARRITFSEEALKLMELQTAPVERKFVTAEIRMVGKVALDERRVKYITAWVPGRIDRLFVDYTGIRVNKGEHLVELYSPELLSAQAELLEAAKAAARTEAGQSELVSRSVRDTLEATREKLRLLGLKQEQIAEIEQTGEPVEHITIYAPIGGVVTDKNATEGMYVQTGTRIYTIADLSKLWVRLDAYESDMMWVRYGQEVAFEAEAYPGEKFTGMISFIDPVLDPQTRTVKLRVTVDNPEGRLRPGMFVHAVVRSRVAQGGRVMDPNMAGKWICSMHPEVVKDSSGTCDICGMELVTTESLGYEPVEAGQAPLVIPASAALITGKRAVVYVELAAYEKPTYEGREVLLGPRAGDYYIVRSGLTEGERVVRKGNFKIDSALQIQAKPSMMNPEEGSAPVVEHIH